MDSRSISMTCTVAVLLYGEHPDLHRRCVQSILSSTPEDVPLRVGLNEVGPQSMDTLLNLLNLHSSLKDIWCSNEGSLTTTLIPGPRPIAFFTEGNENMLKYPMMRHMLWSVPLGSEVLVWVDDDTWFKSPAWYGELKKKFSDPDLMYTGEPWFVHHLEGQWDYIQSRPWFAGKAPEIINGRPGVNFYTGGFVGIRVSALRELSWPDSTLKHNGGDTLLGEAVRQQGWKRSAFPTRAVGVKVNNAERRGYHERPAGATVDVRR